MRRRLAVAAVLAATIALTACAPPGDPSWIPPQWTASEIAVVDAAPPAVDPASVSASLVPLRIRNDDVGLQARVALLPGTDAVAAAFNTAALQRVRDAIAAASGSTGVTYTPAVHAPDAGLADRMCLAGSTTRPAHEILADPAVGAPVGTGVAVVCDIVAASGSLLGQRVRTVAGAPDAVTADAATILYTDTVGGEVLTADALWVEGAAERLSADVVDALRRADGSLTRQAASAGDETQLAAIRAALATTVPGEGGALVFTLAAGFTAPELAALGTPATTEPITVSVPREVAATMVSDFGARLLESTGAPFALPVAGPAGFDDIDCDLVPCVAVTYDDGPSSLTPTVLDELARYRGASTFYVMGEKVGSHGDLLRRMIGEGHEVENHTWNHPRLPKLPDDKVAAQIHDTSGAILNATGERVTSFRPPYGEYTSAVVAIAGLPAILWDVDTLDWQGPSADVLVRRAVDGPRPGSIVLMHDIHPVTAEAAGSIYAGLLDRGFSLVTVTQIFGGDVPSGAHRRA